MDSGSYCEGCYIPCGLTAYERDFLHWRALRTLDKSTTVRLRPLEAGGEGYKIVNKANADEYYVLENHQDVLWDRRSGGIGHGMLVVHVDYDRSAWTANHVNTDFVHQRMSFIPADNMYVGAYNAQSDEELSKEASGQPYPGTSGITSLTDETIPAAVVFPGVYMNQPITQIRELENGDIVFKFMPKGKLDVPVLSEPGKVTSQSFEIRWSEVEHATCYALEVFGVKKEGSYTEEPVCRVDSVWNTSYVFTPKNGEYTAYAYRVSAMDDAYEDSPYSDWGHVEMPADAIKDVEAEVDDSCEIYALNGVLLARGRDALQSLSSGIYIVHTRKGTMKMRIK
ncbi:MAG: hypothetical protein LUC45_01665 [Paraprevotella sp.]|nr:hypothetical protein [Paraprevotella sp.]